MVFDFLVTFIMWVSVCWYIFVAMYLQAWCLGRARKAEGSDEEEEKRKSDMLFLKFSLNT